MKKIIISTMLIMFIFLFSSCSNESSRVITNQNVGELNLNDNLYTICFKQKDGSIISNKILKHDTPITLPDDPTLAPTAKYIYTFIGWDYNNDNIVDEIPDKAEYSFIAVAVYEYTIIEYKVEFEVDTVNYEGELVQTKTYGSSADAPKNLVKEGYTFMGWDKAIDYITGNTVIKAVWQINIYTITLDTKDTGVSFDKLSNTMTIEVIQKQEERLPLPTIVLKDYTYFNGYKNSEGVLVADTTGKIVNDYKFEKDETLTADTIARSRGELVKFGYYPIELVRDEDLIKDLYDYMIENSINDDFSYQGEMYRYLESVDEEYKNSNPYSYYFFKIEMIEFVFVGSFDPVRVGVGSVAHGYFASTKILDYGYQSELNCFDNVELYHYGSSVHYPFGYYPSYNYQMLSRDDYKTYSPLDEEGDFPATDYAKAKGYKGEDYYIYDNDSSKNLCILNKNYQLNLLDDTNKHGMRMCIKIRTNN